MNTSNNSVSQSPSWVWLTVLLVSVLVLAGPTASNLYRSFATLDWRDHPSYEDGSYLLSDHDLVRQAQDATGAAAVLATLLQWRGDPATEIGVLAELGAAGGTDTLEDVALQFAAQGFVGQWLEIKRTGLYSLPLPFVVHLTDTASRLAIVRDARQGFLYIADPLFGNVVMSEDEFVKEWSGRVLTFTNPPEPPR